MSNKFAFSDRELGAHLGISDRRVRQLAQDDCLVSVTAGRWDITHALHFRAGERILRHIGAKEQDKFTTAAVGWLMCHDTSRLLKTDLKHWFSAAKRWKLSQDQAHTLLINAAALLGKRAPTIEV